MEGEGDISKRKKRKRVDVKMQSFSETNDKMPPVVGYFPSGFNPKNGQESDEDPKVRVFKHKLKNHLQLVVSPQKSKIEFVGTSYSGEAAKHQPCTYALGILDKEAESLKIVPIAANKIFRLEPRVKTPPKEMDGVEHTAENKANKRDLTNLYGTKSDIRKARKMDALRQKEGDLVALDDIENKIEGMKVNRDLNRTASAARNIPPHDITATTPDKAYLLDKIILKVDHAHLSDILDLMEAEGDAAFSSEFWQKNDYPSFVGSRIHKLGEVQDEDEKKKLAWMFSYMRHLIKFKNLESHSRKSLEAARIHSVKYYNIPTVIFQRFIKLFADSAADKLSEDKFNLLISYVLVLTLFVDKFETEVSDIAKDLKMTTMSLRLHYQNLGCKLSNVKRSQIVTLPVPLKFPELRIKRR